jgi:SAM-dependent methyltransferase
MEILENNGYTVTGLDISPDMLRIARRRVKGKLHQQDMRNINLPDRFDAIICLGGSFTYMQTEEDVTGALRSFYDHIKPDGVLVFDNFNREGFDASHQGKWWEETQSFDDVIIKRRTLSSGWSPEDGTWMVYWEWYISDESGTRQVNDSQKLQSYTFDYLKDKLQETGFTDVKRVENWRLLIKAKK